MNRRVMAIVGAATAAALGTWLTVRSRSRASRDNVSDIDMSVPLAVSGLPALGYYASFDIEDDRAAEIIARFAPALEAVAREQ